MTKKPVPRLKTGQFVSLDCPVEGCCGTLRQMGHDHWECDGLRDPNHPNKELEACDYSILNGEVYGLPEPVPAH